MSLEELRRHPEGVRFGKPEESRKYEKGLLREDRRPGFETPSGKIEIASSLLAKHGFDPLPIYIEPSEGPVANPELAREYPLVLNTGARIQSTFRSQHLNIPGLVRLQPVPQVLIHPGDAAARGIAEGDLVQVREGFRGRELRGEEGLGIGVGGKDGRHGRGGSAEGPKVGVIKTPQHEKDGTLGRLALFAPSFLQRYTAVNIRA